MFYIHISQSADTFFLRRHYWQWILKVVIDLSLPVFGIPAFIRYMICRGYGYKNKELIILSACSGSPWREEGIKPLTLI